MGMEELAEEKEFAARQDRVLKNWKDLIRALRIRHRVQASYGTKEDGASSSSGAGGKGKGKVEGKSQVCWNSLSGEFG